MQEILVQFLGWEDPLEKEWARRPTSVLMGFSDSSEVKASACNAGDPGSIPGWEDPLEKEKEMVTHSSTLSWKIPWMEEPGRLQYMGS